jgi:hypothetical protein
MKKYLWVILFAFASLGTISAQGLDTSQYTILPYNTLYFSGKSKAATLVKKEIDQIGYLLAKCIQENNTKELKRYNELKKKNTGIKREDFIIDLKRYKLQFIAAINSKGEKVVWVNCFCDDGSAKKYWAQEVVVVRDGGNCFFNLKINLTKGRYYDLMVNGDA